MTKLENIKATFKNTLIYSGSSILGKAVSFIMLPLYAYYLRGEGYGIIGMIDVVLSLLTVVIGYGITGSMRRFYYDKITDIEKNIFISTNISLMFFVVLIVVTPAIIFNNYVAKLAFGKDGVGIYIIIALFTFIANVTSINAENYIIVKQKSIFYTSLAIARLFLTLFLNILFLVYYKMGILGYLYSGLISAIVFCIIMHTYALYNVGLHFNLSDALDILKFSLPMVPGYIALFIRTNADRVILRDYLGLAQVGVMEMIYKFAVLIGVFIADPFEKSYDIKRYEIYDTPEGPSTMARIFTLEMVLLLFVGLILAVEIPLILRMLTPKEFWIQKNMAALAVFSRILNSIPVHFAFGIYLSKKTQLLSYWQIFLAVFSIIINYIFIKYFGLMGALMASCIIAIILNYGFYILSDKYYKIPYEWNKIAFITLVATILYFIIDRINISNSTHLNGILSGKFLSCLSYFNEQGIINEKIRKLIYIISENSVILLDGIVRFLASMSFLFTLFIIGIRPKNILYAIKYKNA